MLSWDTWIPFLSQTLPLPAALRIGCWWLTIESLLDLSLARESHLTLGTAHSLSLLLQGRTWPRWSACHILSDLGSWLKPPVQLCGHLTFLLFSSLSFSHHNSYSQEYLVTNQLLTKFRVAGNASGRNRHSQGPWMSCFYFSALTLKSGANQWPNRGVWWGGMGSLLPLYSCSCARALGRIRRTRSSQWADAHVTALG